MLLFGVKVLLQHDVSFIVIRWVLLKNDVLQREEIFLLISMQSCSFTVYDCSERVHSPRLIDVKRLVCICPSIESNELCKVESTVCQGPFAFL